jgi:hypothetical protein
MTTETLARIKALGRSTTSRAWLTNPIRALAWRVIQPYVEGLLQEIAHGKVDRGTARQLGELKNSTAIAHRLAGLERECEALEAAVATLGAAAEATGAEAAQALAEARAAAAAVALLAADLRGEIGGLRRAVGAPVHAAAGPS